MKLKWRKSGKYAYKRARRYDYIDFIALGKDEPIPNIDMHKKTGACYYLPGNTLLSEVLFILD